MEKLITFNRHIHEIITKTCKKIVIIRRFLCILPRTALVAMYKAFLRPHILYCDIVYDQPNNKTFCTKIEKVQHNALLAITGAIKGTSQINLYKDLPLESLRFKIGNSS